MKKVRKKKSRRPLSTGSTLLNLALSDDPFGGFVRGKYYLLVGDSASGKTFLSMTCLAEAAVSKSFQDYRLVYDNVEDGCLLDLPRLFNKTVAARIEPPSTEDGAPVHSDTVEKFYYHVDDRVKEGQPFVYVLDSMDGLTTKPSEEKFDQHKKAARAGKTAPGSYGDAKAKINSERLRKVTAGIRASGSILVVLAQTRDNLGFGWERRTRAGGRALTFYATAEVWLSVVKPIRKTIGGKEREIGVRVCLEIKKNRITGKRAEIELDIYPTYGIDDLGSMVDYLVEEGVWVQTKQTIEAVGLELKGTREKLLREIEERGLEENVKEIVGECWKRVAEESSVKRKKRYAEEDSVGTD